MKKFSVMLLALAIAAFFAAPAMAVHIGDEGTSTGTSLTVQGTYKVDGEYNSIKWKEPLASAAASLDGIDTVTTTNMDDDFELVVTGVVGDVKGVVDFEIQDGAFAGHDNSKRSGDIVDNYWVEWKFHENWRFKAGEWAVQWGRKFAIYNQGGHNIEVDWNLEGVDLVGIYGKVEDGEYRNGDEIQEADQNQIFLGAKVKAISFFSKLDFWLAYQNVMEGVIDDSSYTTGLVTVDYGIPLGNWYVNGEFGSFFGDTPGDPDNDAEGLYNITEVGVDLNGFAIEGVLLYTDENFQSAQNVTSQFDDDYAPMEWFLDEFNDTGNNVTAIWFTVD
jgi:hypothetical protein